MGKKSTPTAPTPPDPYAVAGAQTGQNVQTAIANSMLGNANVVGPQGSSTFNQIGTQTIKGPNGESYDIPQYQQTISLSPEQQQLYNQQTSLGSQLNTLAADQTSRLQDVLGRPISTSSLPDFGRLPTGAPSTQQLPGGPRFDGAPSQGPLVSSVPMAQAPTGYGASGPIQTSVAQQTAPTAFGDAGQVARSFDPAGNIQTSIGPTDYSADRQHVEDAIYSRLNPQLDRDREALVTRLANEGIARGTDAFNQQMDAFGRQANDARMQAILAGGQEQSRLANLALQGGQFANQAQQQQYEQAAGRGSFANQAQNQAFGQEQARGLYGLQATGQNNAANVTAGTFANQAQNQAEQQAQQRGQFAQNAITANNQFGLQGGQFQNAAQDQAFQQGLTGAGFNNTQAQQAYENAANQAQYGNQLGQQTFGNQTTLAQAQDAMRQAALQEQLSLRNQPINEISSLMNGGQVSLPQFAQFNPGQVANTDLQGSIYNSANLAQQNYQTQLAAQTAKQNALIGGLAGLGGAGLYGLAGGKFGGK